MLTFERLQEVLHYEPETGVFTRKLTTTNACKQGDVAGYIREDGRRSIRIDSKMYRASRLAYFYMTGVMPSGQIDHINRIRDDDRFCNLREATPTENGRNRNLFKNNRSGVVGVTWSKRSEKWKTSIRINTKLKHLGYYTDFDEAAMVATAARKQHFGDFYAPLSHQAQHQSVDAFQ